MKEDARRADAESGVRESRSSYTRTELGLIPEDWKVKPLRSILSKGRLGGNYPNQNTAAEYPLMKMGNIARGYFDISKVEFIKNGVRPESQHRLVYGDVLFNTRNTLELVGKVAVWRAELPLAYYNSNLLRLEFDPRAISSNEYANYALNTAGSVARLRALATGTTSVAAIYTRDLLDLPFIVPPPPEQRAIAEALSDVDALLDGLDRLIAKKRDLKQAVMQQLLTGQTRLPGFDGKWEVKQIRYAGRCLRGVSYKGESDLSTHDKKTTKRLLRANNIQNSAILTADIQFVNAARVAPHQNLQPNDILVCMANGSKSLVGKVGLFTVNDGYAYTFGAFMGCFRTDATAANPHFVFFLLQTGQYRNYINNLLAGSSINNLRPSSIESLEFSLPAHSEQTAIAEVLTTMDAELTALEHRREKTRSLKQAMIQELLTGRIRLA
jgi:type I restriction enzyme, S subunit